MKNIITGILTGLMFFAILTCNGDAVQTAFNTGELSPALYGRVDLAKYKSGCKTLENFIPLPHGPAERRAGTEYINEVFGCDRSINGTFAGTSGWTAGTGWTVASNATATNGTASYLYTANCTCTEAREYVVVYTTSGVTDGNVTAYLGGTSLTKRATNGTFTERGVFGSTNTRIGWYKDANFAGVVDDFSVREVNPKAVLIGFEFSVVQAYVLEFTENQIRFYRNGGIILNDDDSIYTLTTTYDEDDLADLHTTQSADILYIAHPSYAPSKLMRYGHNEWELETIDFLGSPFRNITGATQTDPVKVYCPNHGLVDEDEITIWDVGGMTAINTYHIVTGCTDGSFQLRGVDGTGGAYSAYTSGGQMWKSQYTITGATKADPVVITLTDHGFANGDRIQTAGVGGMTEINFKNFTVANRTEDTFELQDINGTGYTAYTSGGRAGAWTELFEEADHYPSSVEFFEERLIWAATNEKPQTIFGSQVGDYENLLDGVNDDEAFVYTIASRGVNSIQWIVPTDRLVIGTKGGEWIMTSSGTDEPITPSNVSIKRQSAWGSDGFQALLVNDAVLFVQRGGTKLREFVYSFEKDGYLAPDLTMLAEHITEGGMVDMAYQQEPNPVLWVVRADGVMLTMAYDRSQNVVGWSRQISDGDFKRVAVITGSTDDEVWTTVERTIDSMPRLYIERLGDYYVDSYITWSGGGTTDITGITQAAETVVTASGHSCSDDDYVRIVSVGGMTDLNDVIYIVSDSNTTAFKITDGDGCYTDTTAYDAYTSGGTVEVVAKTFSGLDHLVGEDVALLGDECVVTDEEVSASGVIVLDDYVGTLIAGLEYQSTLETLNLESEIPGETQYGRIRRIHELLIRFKDSQACWVENADGDWESIPFRDDADPMDEPIPAFTGDKRISMYPGAFGTEVTVKLMVNEPYPLTIVALFPQFRQASR